MKKKIVSLALVVALIAIAAMGTLAYFTDTDAETNVFTTGNVEIDLQEVFDAENAKLMPGIDINKDVFVKNTGSENAYVRIHMAVPAILDSGSDDLPQFAAYNNTLHWNFTGASVQEGQWTQFPTTTEVGANAAYPNWPGNGGNYNEYQKEIDGVLYNVYVMTYETVLAPEETTATQALDKVYLDTKVTNEDMTAILEELETIQILVVAEGAQAEGFDDACVALDTQFGKPGTYNPFA